MDTQILMSYLQSKQRLDRAVDTLKEFITSVYSPAISRYDGTPSDGCPEAGMSIAAAIDRKEELEKTVRERSADAAEKNRIVSLIAARVGGREEEYIIERYIGGYDRKTIAKHLGVCRRTLDRLKRRALDKVSKLA